MSEVINVLDFEEEIEKILNQVKEKTVSGLDRATTRISTIAVEEIKRKSPVRATPYGGSYKAGWRKKEDRDLSRQQMAKVYQVHNATDYQLTHLLEFGHANARGTGRTPAYVHIEPVQKMIDEKYTAEAEKEINNELERD